MPNLLDNKIEFLKGVGPKRAALLNKEAGIASFGDLLNYFPFRYIDKSHIYKVSEVTNDQTWFQLVGDVSALKVHGSPRATRVTATFSDDSGSIELVWFKGLKWLKEKFLPGQRYVLFGKASAFNNKFNFVHPDVELFDPADQSVGGVLQGVYPTTENMKNMGLGSKQIARLTKTLLQQLEGYIPETLPEYLILEEKLMRRSQACQNIHWPTNNHSLKQATLRLSFEEYFFFQLRLISGKMQRERTSRSFVFQRIGALFNEFYSRYLPFELTEAQKKVIREIRHDLGSGIQMNRLLQGDVGSGKTIVALMAMLIALDNGYQAAFMAPTEILATQHYHSLKKLLGELPVSLALLTGSSKATERKLIDTTLQDGSLHLIVGTHALIEDNVVFSKLGLVIIDEQHRFGVAQRAKLREKNDTPPHMLVMTATPIPRTLAMTQYGDLDVSVIDELPPGRKPIKTIHLYQHQRLRMLSFVRKQLAEGRQVYIVYPLIKESEKLDLINLQEGYESLLRDFPEPQYQICVVHGQMKTEDKDWEMQRFVRGQAHIMVATTVIEVGVDIPNASVMVIEHADRFGLAQLHQLRGRVGRGADQSYCLLMTDFKLTADGKKRMLTMVSSTDGFEIAAVDLELRGPGDTQGTLQSGQLEFKLGNLAKDEKLIRHTRGLAQKLLTADPALMQPQHAVVKTAFMQRYATEIDWGSIG
ncbi:MAG: ATP-dependent DNA helicase RecG [Bacteroidales bacterium]|nr:ATP-dependent DNA helicase RecG [Bacteroidales bacterium]